MLSVPGIWFRPSHRRAESKKRLTIGDGDHLTLLNVYNSYVQHKGDRDWARDNYLSACSLAEAENARSQLERIMERYDVALLSTADESKRNINIRRALCRGFFMQVAHKEGASGYYLTVKDCQVAYLHPSCSLGTQPDWVIFNEFILTTRPYLRTATGVEPEWLLELASVYFDLASFPDGEAKRALRRIAAKMAGKFGHT